MGVYSPRVRALCGVPAILPSMPELADSCRPSLCLGCPSVVVVLVLAGGGVAVPAAARFLLGLVVRVRVRVRG